MLHNEARKLLLKALATTHNAKEVAECFSVHISTVYRLKKQIDETGSVETRTNPLTRIWNPAFITGIQLSRLGLRAPT